MEEKGAVERSSSRLRLFSTDVTLQETEEDGGTAARVSGYRH